MPSPHPHKGATWPVSVLPTPPPHPLPLTNYSIHPHNMSSVSKWVRDTIDNVPSDVDYIGQLYLHLFANCRTSIIIKSYTTSRDHTNAPHYYWLI